MAYINYGQFYISDPKILQFSFRIRDTLRNEGLNLKLLFDLYSKNQQNNSLTFGNEYNVSGDYSVLYDSDNNKIGVQLNKTNYIDLGSIKMTQGQFGNFV